MKLLPFIFVNLFMCSGWASPVHSVVIKKFYTSPVSTTQAMTDLEQEAKATILSTCGNQRAGVQKLVVSIPFGVMGGTAFYADGIPGSTAKPVFRNFSYPTVSAELEFSCAE